MTRALRARRWFARQAARPALRAPLAPLIALVAAGAVLVAHGEPSPVQQYSGVSVPVGSGSSGPAAKELPALLTLADGALLRIAGDQRTPVGLPADATPTTLQQVTLTESAAMALRPDGQHAFLLPGSGGAIDLGLADRLVPGATPAAIAVERDAVVQRYDGSGSPVGAPVALPAGMALGADSTLGIVASTVVGPITPVEDGIAPVAADILANTRTALQRGGMWLPVGPYQPLSASGAVALLWDPLGAELGLLDLRRLAILQPLTADQLPGSPITPVPPEPTAAAPTAPTNPTDPVAAPSPSTVPIEAVPLSLLPVPFPALRGVNVTGPAAFSFDGKWIAIAARVGDRPRLVVGPATLAIVRGDTKLSSLSVISLGGVLGPDQFQPVPVWSQNAVIAARLDGSLIVYSTLTGKAVGQPLPQPVPTAVPPTPSAPGTTASPQPTGELPIDANPTGLPSDTGSGAPTSGSGEVLLPVIGGLGIG